VAFTHVTLTRDYDLSGGDPPIGTVSFTPSAWLVNSSVTVPAAPVTAALDAAGVITIALAANTDPATVPADSYYTVAEDIVGQARRSYRIYVPHNAGPVLDLGRIETGSAGVASPHAGLATGTGSANGAAVPASTASATAGVATGAGTALPPLITVPSAANAIAGRATGTGTAYGATVAFSINASAVAGCATGTGTARQPAATVRATSATAGRATGTGTASGATVSAVNGGTSGYGLGGYGTSGYGG
jgi:hypothetical protein